MNKGFEGATEPSSGATFAALVPTLFVFLWSTGFIGAKFGLPYAGPMTFLLWRFVLVVAILTLVALFTHAAWPKTFAEAGHIGVAGLLVQGTYLTGVFSAMHLGMSAGLVALIVGMQPVLTATVSGRLLGERVSMLQWGGLAIGLCGLAFVVFQKMTLEAPAAAYVWAVAGLLGITCGTLYQKRYCSRLDLTTGAAIQFGASALALAVIAPLSETLEVIWSGEFVFALLWAVLVLSVGTTRLLFILIRRGEAARIASLFYLTPAVTALIAFLLFNERLTAVGIFGMLLTAIGVALAVRK